MFDPFFAETIAAALSDVTIRCALLLEFDFLSGTYRIWNGYGSLITKDGNTWQGLGEVGSISGLEEAINGTAPAATVMLSGVTPQAVLVANNSWFEARFRPFIVYLQFFSAIDGSLLDKPAAINRFTMEQIEINSTGPSTRDITFHCENVFTARGFPTQGWLSDRDQQARYPGDNGLSRIAILQYHTVTFPPA